jgi:GNAT superfamily N-acetyltransferase
MLRAKRLTAQQAGALWQAFYEAHGQEVMWAAYGWETPTSRAVRPGERVWAFSNGASHVSVGWGSCDMSLTDPEDDEAVMALGVFPAFQRQGYRHQILDWMSDWARKRGAKMAKIVVFKDNEGQYERTMREAYEQPECPWVHAGEVWLPSPGHGIFVRDLTPECDEIADLKDAIREAA